MGQPFPKLFPHPRSQGAVSENSFRNRHAQMHLSETPGWDHTSNRQSRHADFCYRGTAILRTTNKQKRLKRDRRIKSKNHSQTLGTDTSVVSKQIRSVRTSHGMFWRTALELYLFGSYSRKLVGPTGGVINEGSGCLGAHRKPIGTERREPSTHRDIGWGGQ